MVLYSLCPRGEKTRGCILPESTKDSCMTVTPDPPVCIEKWKIYRPGSHKRDDPDSWTNLGSGTKCSSCFGTRPYFTGLYVPSTKVLDPLRGWDDTIFCSFVQRAMTTIQYNRPFCLLSSIYANNDNNESDVRNNSNVNEEMDEDNSSSSNNSQRRSLRSQIQNH